MNRNFALQGAPVHALVRALAVAALVGWSSTHGAWNNPYPESEAEANIIYSSEL